MKKQIVLLLAAVALFAAACVPEPFLSLSEGQSSEITIGSNSECATVKINANNAWTAVSSESWITISPSAGEAGEASISVSVAANTSYDQRMATITITSEGLIQTITVKQAQKDAFELRSAEFLIGSDGGTITVPVSANAEYYLEVYEDCKDWLSVTKTKAMSDYSIELSVKKNTRYESRTGRVKVYMANAESTITITQSQLDELIINTRSFKIGSNGGTISIPIKSNIKYESEILESAKGWIEITEEKTKGLVDNPLMLNIRPNEDYDGRTGQIRISGAGKESIVSITQSQLDEIILTTTSYKIGSSGGTVQVPIQSNIDFDTSILSGNDWLKVEIDATKGLSESIMLITVSENDTYDGRNGQIKVSGAGKESVVTVFQSQLDEFILGGETVYSLPRVPKVIYIPVKTNVEFQAQVISGSDWLQTEIVKAKALEDYQIVVRTSLNSLYSTRVGQIQVSSEDGKQTIITVYQEQTDKVYVDMTPYEIGSEGGTLIIPLYTNIEPDVRIESGEEWISVIRSVKAYLEQPLYVTVLPNETYDDRSATIRVSGGNESYLITINQSQLDELLVPQTKYTVECIGGEIEIPIETNIDLSSEVLGDASSWITIVDNETKALESRVVKLIISENHYHKRHGKVQLSGADKNTIISITQQESSIPYIYTNELEYSYGVEGGELVFSVSANVDVTMSDTPDWMETKREKQLAGSTNGTEYCFNIRPNLSDGQRTAEVHFTNEEHKLSVCVIIKQEYEDVLEATASMLKSMDPLAVKKLRIKGTLSPSVFRDVRGRPAFPNLVYLDIADIGKERMDDYVFSGYTRLETLILPKTLVAIPEYAFQFCSQLRDLVIPSTVRSIGRNAFTSCYDLGTLVLPKSVKFVDYHAFQYTKGDKLIINGHIEKWSYDIFGDSKFAHIYCDDPNSYIIGASAFSGNDALVSITFAPNSIGARAFKNCINLKQVNCLNWATVGVSAFEGCKSLETFTTKSGIGSALNASFWGCSSLKSIAFSTHAHEIGDLAFCGCKSLSSVVLSEWITKIGISAFRDCISLTTLSLPDRLSIIGDLAFMNCTGLTKLSIPSIVTTIGQSTFYNCTGLTTLSISNNVTTIGNNAFYNCTGLTKFTIPNRVTAIGESAFYNCTGLTKLSIPSTLTSIANNTFMNCSRLTSIVIPETISSIGESAFEACSNLKSVTLAEGLGDICSRAFYDCPLAELTIPSTVSSIGDIAFYNIDAQTIYCKPSKLSITGDTLTFGPKRKTIYVPRESTLFYYFWSNKDSYKVVGYDF